MRSAKLENCTCYNQKTAFQNRARVMDQNAESLYSCGFSAFVFINA